MNLDPRSLRRNRKKAAATIQFHSQIFQFFFAARDVIWSVRVSRHLKRNQYEQVDLEKRSRLSRLLNLFAQQDCFKDFLIWACHEKRSI